MVILQIEHAVPDFDRWKEAFDNDPAGRQRSGVRRYQILRPLDAPNVAIIELEFDTAHQAEALLTNLRQNVWSRIEGTLIHAPQARIVEIVDRVDY